MNVNQLVAVIRFSTFEETLEAFEQLTRKGYVAVLSGNTSIDVYK